MLCPEDVAKSSVDSVDCRWTVARQHYLDTIIRYRASRMSVGPVDHHIAFLAASGEVS
jgi:hypothetical protein